MSFIPEINFINSMQKELPIYSKEDEILKSIEQNKVTLICGDTGCGKTTQVPQMIYKHFGIQKMIGIT